MENLEKAAVSGKKIGWTRLEILLGKIGKGVFIFGSVESARERQNVKKNRHMGLPIGKTGVDVCPRPDDFH